MSIRHKYADVVVDLSAKTADQSYQYVVPQKWADIKLGSTVVVPFAGRQLIGYVVGLANEPRRGNLRELIALIDEPPLFTDNTIKLFYWMHEYYLCSLGDCLKLIIPPGRTRHLIEEYLLKPASEGSTTVQPELLDRLKSIGNPLTKKTILKETDAATFKDLLANQILQRKYIIATPKISEKTIKVISCGKLQNNQVTSVKGAKQKLILEMLSREKTVRADDLLEKCEASLASLKSLEAKGLIKIDEVNEARLPKMDYFDSSSMVENLTRDQEEAVSRLVDAISLKKQRTFLLEGVTGSGKTEVYLRAIEKIVEQGRGAIVLTPEIALTPQLTSRFRRRFKDLVALLHSGLSLGERYDEWQRIRRGDALIVVGARSALFAPVNNLGLIVIDEEHETSYKQNRSPRYQTREVAAKIAEINKAVIIFGSATPSLETKLKAENGLIEHLKLPERVKKRRLPAIEIVDMREEFKKDNYSVFSGRLKNAMVDCLENREKMIVFLNRRGYSSFLLCRDCGYVPKCRNCSVSLTFHQNNNRLICHHCLFNQRAPSTCPACGGHNLRFLGIGTQKVERELEALFPEVPIIRMDADTTKKKDSHRQFLVSFAKHKSAILLGTQMVAKGLDFPEVSLIGVINADISLNIPDFRSAERTFQLLTQVAGRSGRGESPGLVIIQTYSPDNYAIAAVKKGDWRSFYQKEMGFRRELDYPPFSNMINLLITGIDENKVKKRAHEIASFLKNRLYDETLNIYGPGASPIPRIKNQWRWHIIITTSAPGRVKSLISQSWSSVFADKSETNVIVDVDPVWLL